MNSLFQQLKPYLSDSSIDKHAVFISRALWPARRPEHGLLPMSEYQIVHILLSVSTSSFRIHQSVFSVNEDSLFLFP